MARLFLSITAALAVWISPLWAGDNWRALYDVHLIGAKIGEISIAGTQQNGSYSAKTRFATTGVVKAMKRMRAEVSVTGRTNGPALRPYDYAEAIDDGRRVTNVKVRFGGAEPRLVSGDTGSSAVPADTSGLRDALDPLSALYALLRDQPREALCRFSSDVYDGHRHARIAVGNPKASGNGVTCSGSYRRVAGYSSSERRQKQVPISIEYEPAGNMMRAARISVQTRYGKALLLRR